MSKLRIFLLSILFSIFLFAPSIGAEAQPSFTPPAKATAKASLFAPISEQIQSLVTGTPPKDPQNGDDNDVESQQTIGVRALDLAISAYELLRAQSDTFATNISGLPQLSSWYQLQNTDARLHSRWSSTGDDLLIAVGLPLVAAVVLELLLLPGRNNLRRRKPSDFSKRLVTVLWLFALKLIPLAVFVVASLALIDQNEPHKLPRFVVLNVIYALTLSRLVVAFIRSLFAPNVEALRLIPTTTSQATYAYRWLRAFSLVIIYGYFCVDVARAVHVPPAVIIIFGNILSLALVIMTLLVIVQKRAFVATLLRGNLSAASADLSLFQNLRLWFARNWHVLAATYLIIGYLITALGVENGFVLMLRGTILTLLILTIMRLLFHATDRWGANDASASSAIHHTILRFLMRLVIWTFALVGAAAAWGVDIPELFATPFGQRILGAAFSIGLTVIIVALIYEGCNSVIERHLNRRDAEGKKLAASARMRTLLPMIRTSVFIGFSIIVSLVVLSEVGFNIAPLLAGAGIFGVAIGFGSQTLVKDFLTGLFIVIENTIAIGDTVKIGDHAGVAEAMSVRTLRLRDGDGALHILPFSEVTKIINMTRDFSFAVIKVGVSYDSDLEKVMNVIRSVGEELQNDPIYKRVILEPVEVLGVEDLGDSSVTIGSRIRTRPGKQWDVRRMFLLKLKQRFDKEGIEIPFPTVTNIQKPHPTAE